jgi:hypothetical protein
MRGSDTFPESLFTLRKLEDFVPADHPLRPIRLMVNTALVKMDALFSCMCETDIKGGRPSIAPEKLLRAMLLQPSRVGTSLCPRGQLALNFVIHYFKRKKKLHHSRIKLANTSCHSRCTSSSCSQFK